MHVNKEDITQRTIKSATFRSKKLIERQLKIAKNIIDDPKKEARLKSCKCLSCFYVLDSRIGGRVMTTKPCGICEIIMQFPSTITNHLCTDCASENNLCASCGGQLDINISEINIKKNSWYCFSFLYYSQEITK